MDKREVSPIRAGKRSDMTLNPSYKDDDFASLAAHEGDGRLFKMEIDYTSQVDEALLKADAIARTGDVVGAVDSLSALEKLTRLGVDMRSNTRIVEYMVKLCFEGANWTFLNDTITVLSKKRSIIKMAIAKMVRDCCEMIDKMPNEEVKMKLIETLRTITGGKIYVEVERARLTYRLVKKLESEGKIDEAATMLLELEIETYGSMEMQEKIELLLEQMRLCLMRKDFIRASIITKKISKKFFQDKSDAVQSLKLKYYDLMVELALNDKAYLDLCRYYLEVYDTPSIQADIEKTKHVIKCIVLYVLLAPYTNEQWDLMHRIHLMRKLEIVPEYNSLLELFINQEIIAWKQVILRQFQVLLRKGTAQNHATGIFADNEVGEKHWLDFQTRVGEHNMRMIGKYYTQITFDRLAQLIDYPPDIMEDFLCNLIVNGTLPDAKIHRPSRIVNLRARKANIEQLDQWATSIRQLTDILNKVSHLITKEEMVHRHLDDGGKVH